MIVRETKEAFTMIAQDDHGHAAEQIMRNWKQEEFADGRWRDSVLFAIAQHDVGWAPFDAQPFWNDAEQKPYDFTNFPVLSKTVLYRRGIDIVEEQDPYAAMLCSIHYEHFLAHDETEAARNFVQEEQHRRKMLALEIPDFNKDLFKKHYGYLQPGDNFSLYSCLNEPGTSKENEHPFFKKGIPIPGGLRKLFSEEELHTSFKDNTTVTVKPFPFESSFDVTIKQKTVTKQDIKEQGLLKAYAQAPIEEISLKFV